MNKIVFIICIILFVSCANTVKEPDTVTGQKAELEEVENLSGKYHLISLKGKDVSSEEIFFKINSRQNSLEINTECNVLLVDFLQQEEKIKFQSPVSTKMYCEGKMEIENNLNLILPKIVKIDQSADGVLKFTDGKEVLITIQKQKE